MSNDQIAADLDRQRECLIWIKSRLSLEQFSAGEVHDAVIAFSLIDALIKNAEDQITAHQAPEKVA